MLYRPSPTRTAKHQQTVAWSSLPDSVFEDLGLDRSALAEFNRSILGNIILPGEGIYPQAASTSFQVSSKNPKIIVYCDVEEDVRQCLLRASRHGWWIVPRSGGHSTAGYSVNDGMVIDVSRINSVYVDPAARTATIGAGARFETINAVLNSYKLHLPGGICPDVGVAGYMQGGGYSYTSRQFGMNCDSVIGFRMMLKDGRTVMANANQNADLFWAVRGGTGNNFGILLDITYRVYPVWEVWAFGLAWSREDAPRVLEEIQSRFVHTGGPSKLGFMGLISKRIDFGDKPIFSIRGMYLGSAEEGRAELRPLLDIGDPVIDVDTIQPYISALNTIDYADVVDLEWSKVKEDKQASYLDKPLRRADWARVMDYFEASPPGTINLACFEPMGGAIEDQAPDACAFVHRNADLDFFVDTFWTDDADAKVAADWLDGFMDLVSPFSNGRVYQNYPRRSLTDTNRRYFGDNYDRLLAVKNKYDPLPRMFHFEQGICKGADDAGTFLNGPPPVEFSAEPIVFEPHNDAE